MSRGLLLAAGWLAGALAGLTALGAGLVVWERLGGAACPCGGHAGHPS